eukprot:SM000225S07014  [mRNA]  locus=s225:9831:21645:- [translate_table: standard]
MAAAAAPGWGRSRWWFGRVIDPRRAPWPSWNRLLLISCGLSISVDPLHFFLLAIDRRYLCIYIQGYFAVVITVLRSLTDLIYLAHVALSLRTGYVSAESMVVGWGELVVDARRIAAHYLRWRGGFWLDLFVLLPIPQLALWVVVPAVASAAQGTFTAILLVLLVTLVQYVRKVYHAITLMRRMQRVNGYVFGTVWWAIALNMAIYIISSHLVGAVWYLLSIQRVEMCLYRECKTIPGCDDGRMSCRDPLAFGARVGNTLASGEPWGSNATTVQRCLSSNTTFTYGLYTQALPLVTETNGLQKILYAFFWGIMSLSSFANALTPSNYMVETIFALFIVIAGVLLFVLLVGNIQVFLHSITERMEAMQLRKRDLQWWMRRRQLPARLQQRVVKYERHMWAATRGVDEEAVLHGLPDSLQRDIKRHLCLDLVRKVPLFKHMDRLVLDAICMRLRPVVYLEKTTLVRAGEPVKRMIFIIRGHLQCLHQLSSGTVSTIVLGPGKFSGEELVGWCLSSRPATADVLPLATSDLSTVDAAESFVLEAQDLKYVTEHFRQHFRGRHLQHAIRHYSPHWRTWAAVTIQLAYRRYRAKQWAAVMAAVAGGEASMAGGGGGGGGGSEASGSLAAAVPYSGQMLPYSGQQVPTSGQLVDSGELRRNRLRIYTAMFTSPKPADSPLDLTPCESLAACLCLSAMPALYYYSEDHWHWIFQVKFCTSSETCRSYYVSSLQAHLNKSSNLSMALARFTSFQIDNTAARQAVRRQWLLRYLTLGNVVLPLPQLWNRLFLLSCVLAVTVDPLFFYTLAVDSRLLCAYVQATPLLVVTLLRSATDAMYFLHMWLSLRMAYVSKASMVLGRGELVEDARAIVRHYTKLRGGFLVDLFVVLPVPQIAVWVTAPAMLRAGASTDAVTWTLLTTILAQYFPRAYHTVTIMRRMERVTGYVFGTAWWGFALNLTAYIIAAHVSPDAPRCRRCGTSQPSLLQCGVMKCPSLGAGGHDQAAVPPADYEQVAGAVWYLFTIQRVCDCLGAEIGAQGRSLRLLACPTPLAFGSQLDDGAGRAAWGSNVTVHDQCLRTGDPFSTYQWGIYKPAVSLVYDSNFLEKILLPLFWGTISFANALVPSNSMSEVVFSIIIVISGLLLFMLLIGNIQVFLHNITSRMEGMQLHRRDLEFWMRRRQLPWRLKQAVRRFERQRWAATRGVNEEAMVQSLPESLRRDIKRHLCLDLVRKVPLFEKMEDLVLDNICERLRPIHFTAGMQIMRQGEPVQRMLFIIRGHLQTKHKLTNGKVSTILLGPGSSTGEELLSWCLSKRVDEDSLPCSSAGLVASDGVEAFVLEAEDLKYVTTHFHFQLRSKHLRHMIKHYSPHWRTWAAVTIQLAWRRYRAKQWAAENPGSDEASRHGLLLPPSGNLLPFSGQLSGLLLPRSGYLSGDPGELKRDRLRMLTAMFASPKPREY